MPELELEYEVQMDKSNRQLESFFEELYRLAGTSDDTELKQMGYRVEYTKRPLQVIAYRGDKVVLSKFIDEPTVTPNHPKKL